MDERGERTERPTPRARERARERGDIPHSTELSSVGVLLFGFLAMFLAMGTWLSVGRELFANCLGYIRFASINGDEVAALYTWALNISLRMLAPVFLAVTAGGLFINLIQTKGNISAEKLKPNLQRLNPVTNFRNLFSMRRLFEAFKSIIKIVLAAAISYSVIHSRLDLIAISGIKRDPMAYITTFGKLAFELGIKLALAFLILAIFDYMYQRWEYEKKLMMTRQEVKEDYKQSEGDPLVKYRLRQRARQIAMTRMLREVPRADVVITNPLEVAVALRYDEGEMPAPTVVAKGKGRIAERIRDLAKEFDIPIYPDPPLARSLYAACEVGDLIPYELYRAIAEVLAYIYSMEGRRVKRA